VWLSLAIQSLGRGVRQTILRMKVGTITSATSVSGIASVTAVTVIVLGMTVAKTHSNHTVRAISWGVIVNLTQLGTVVTTTHWGTIAAI